MRHVVVCPSVPAPVGAVQTFLQPCRSARRFLGSCCTDGEAEAQGRIFLILMSSVSRLGLSHRSRSQGGQRSQVRQTHNPSATRDRPHSGKGGWGP